MFFKKKQEQVSIPSDNSYKKDFTFFLEHQDIIYFDNACMTFRPDVVVQAMERYYHHYPACAGRSYHKLASYLTKEIDKARKIVADFFGAKEQEIIFTKNATEGVNLVAHSLDFEENDVVLTTDKEHNSNLLPWLRLSQYGKITHKVVESEKDNTINPQKFEEAIEQVEKEGKQVKLISIVAISNLDGVQTPVEEIVAIAKKHEILVLIDAAQAAGHKKLDVKKLDVDFMVCSAHKMMGPSGIGCVYIKKELQKSLSQFLIGGETVSSATYHAYEALPAPQKYEAGLQNYPGILGFAAACDYIKGIGFDKIQKHDEKLNAIITEELKEQLDSGEITLIGPREAVKRTGVFSFTVKGADAHEVAMLLDKTDNIAVRSGQHCVHAWFAKANIPGSVRASLYIYNSESEARQFAKALKEVLLLVK